MIRRFWHWFWSSTFELEQKNAALEAEVKTLREQVKAQQEIIAAFSTHRPTMTAKQIAETKRFRPKTWTQTIPLLEAEEDEMKRAERVAKFNQAS